MDQPSKGRWAGYIFVNEQAGDELFPVRSRDRKRVILDAILLNVAEALANYGHELGQCGICRRTLTDPESIARGIGPICYGKVA